MKRAGRGMTLLWLLLSPFTIWAAHFLTAYVVTAIHCAKSPDVTAAIAAIRVIVVAVTLLALAALAAVLRFAYARYPPDATADGAPDRRAGGEARFLRSVLAMMTALSGVAVVYAAAVVFFFGDCR